MAFEHNDIVAVNRMNEAISEGGGGGDSTPLICTYDSDAGHLDTTFGDIWDALLSGRSVLQFVNGNAYGCLNKINWYETTGDEDETIYYGNLTFANAVLITVGYSSFDELMAAYPFYAD